MVSTMDLLDNKKVDISKEKIKDRFFKELKIDQPTQEQRESVESISPNDLIKPVLSRMLKEGKTYGEIAQYLGVPLTPTLYTRISRVKKRYVKVK